MFDSTVPMEPYAWQWNVLEAIRESPAVAIVGAPGSGKSTVALWALSKADEGQSALLITPSTRTVEKATVSAGTADITVITNRLLREAWWSTESRPVRAVTTPDVVASPPSSRRLSERPWSTVILDGVDEWPLEARQGAEDLLRLARPAHAVVTSRRQSLARTLLSDTLLFQAPAPSRVGAITALRYHESNAESEVRNQIEGLTQFAGPEADRLGLHEVLRAWGSSPYAAQQAALKHLGRLRPERNVAAHTPRVGAGDSLLLLVVHGLELIVDAIDRLEFDSRADRFLSALENELDQSPRIWLVTGERATSEYLQSRLDFARSSGSVWGSRVRIDYDGQPDTWQPLLESALLHYDLPSAAAVQERAWLSRRISPQPLTQWALLRIGDGRARGVLRSAENR